MRFPKRAGFLAACIVWFSLLPHAVNADAYGSIADFLNALYGIDKNAGLTAFPVLNIPMGGMAEGMASAFSSVAGDISFLEYNPAGSSMLQKTELGFFHNNWIADSRMEGIAYANRFGNFGFGAGMKWLYLPFTEYNIYGDRVSNGYYSEGVFVLNASYNLFSGYYFSGVSFGMNLKGAFRIMPDYTDNYEIIKGSGLSQSAIMAMADIGILTRFNMLKFYTARDRNTSAALVIRNLGPPALGDPLPTAVNLSFSYRPIRPLLFSLDFTAPINLMDIRLSELPYGALGISVNITNFLSMHAGVMIKAGSSRITIGSALNLKTISLDINYTLDLLTQMQPLNRVSLAVRFDLGDNGRRNLSDTLDELYLLGIEAYSYGKFLEARMCWEEALRLDPKYSPARESLEALQRRDDLLWRIDNIYVLEEI